MEIPLPPIIEQLRVANWLDIRSEIHSMAMATFSYWLALYEIIFCGRSYDEISMFKDDRWAKVQVFSLSLIFRMWKRPHYRSTTFQQDMIDNLKNVAIPGTGVPLSIFCYSWWVCLYFILFVNPLVCLLGAINKSRKIRGVTFEQLVANTCRHYVHHLLHPQDWFSFWRLNCRLVSYHSMVTRAIGYKQEDKWTFLVDGCNSGVPVSPFMDVEAIVCKNKNIEGGMGIFFYKNAAHGGDWILQSRMYNTDWLCALLPPSAPLSTMRVITTSTWALAKNMNGIETISSPYYDEASPYENPASPDPLAEEKAEATWTDSPPGTVLPAGLQVGAAGGGKGLAHTAAQKARPASIGNSSNRSSSSGSGSGSTAKKDLTRAAEYVTARSAVLRLGRAGAATDHSSILFDVDMTTGVIKEGATNAHWYHLGPHTAVRTCPWLPQKTYMKHPDAPHPVVTGKTIPNMQEALKIVTE